MCGLNWLALSIDNTTVPLLNNVILTLAWLLMIWIAPINANSVSLIFGVLEPPAVALPVGPLFPSPEPLTYLVHPPSKPSDSVDEVRSTRRGQQRGYTKRGTAHLWPLLEHALGFFGSLVKRVVVTDSEAR